MKAVLQFIDYHVTNIEYLYDPSFIEDEADLKPDFSFELEFADENKEQANLQLGIELGDRNLEKNSIYVNCKVKGEFIIEAANELDEGDKIDYYRINGVAILYPYLRSLVSDVTGKGSEQAVILPTMNIIKMIQDQEQKAHQ